MKLKKYLYLSVISLLIISFHSCDSDTNHEISKDKDYSVGIVGKWNWIETRGPIPLSETNPLTPKNAGYTNSVLFNPDSSWCKLKNDVVIESGEKFTTGKGVFSILIYEYKYDSIAYYKNEVVIATDYYKLSNDTLSFSTSFKGVVGSGVTDWIRVSQ